MHKSMLLFPNSETGPLSKSMAEDHIIVHVKDRPPCRCSKTIISRRTQQSRCTDIFYITCRDC